MTTVPESPEGVQHDLFLAEGDAFIRFYSLDQFSWTNKDQAYLSLQFLFRFHEYKCRALTSPYLLDDLWFRIESALIRSNFQGVLEPGFSLNKEHIDTVIYMNTATLSETLAHGGWNGGEQWISDTSVYFAMVDLIRSPLNNQPPRSLRVLFCNPEFCVEDGRILAALGAEVVRLRHIEESYEESCGIEKCWNADTLFFDELTETMFLGKYMGKDGNHRHGGGPSGSGSAPPPPPHAPAPAPVPVPRAPATTAATPNLFSDGRSSGPSSLFGEPSGIPAAPNTTPSLFSTKPADGQAYIFGKPSGVPAAPNTAPSLFSTKPAYGQASIFGKPSGVPAAPNTTPSLFPAKPANGQADGGLFNLTGLNTPGSTQSQGHLPPGQQQLPAPFVPQNWGGILKPSSLFVSPTSPSSTIPISPPPPTQQQQVQATLNAIVEDEAEEEL